MVAAVKFSLSSAAVLGILSGLAACSVDDVTFKAPAAADLDAGPDAKPDGRCGVEICDGLDNDCSGTADYAEAIGAAASCAATSCVDVRDHNPASASGRWWVKPTAAAAFEVYCDQVTDGGGWTLVWRNHGGSKGGEESNASLFARAAAGSGDPIVLPPKQALTSAIHQRAFDAYWDATQREWLKITTLWKNDGTVENDQHIRVQMRGSSMKSVFAAPVSYCNEVATKFQVIVNGTVDFGETNLVNHYSGETFGLANNGNGNMDSCNQPVENLIRDPVAAGSLYRLDGGDTVNTIRHLFSYSHVSAGFNASRCLYNCWTGMLTHYDAFVWAVR